MKERVHNRDELIKAYRRQIESAEEQIEQIEQGARLVLNVPVLQHQTETTPSEVVTQLVGEEQELAEQARVIELERYKDEFPRS